jgi:hypothetical protein
MTTTMTDDIELITYHTYVWTKQEVLELKAELFGMAVAAEPTPKKTSKNKRIRELAYALEAFTTPD